MTVLKSIETQGGTAAQPWVMTPAGDACLVVKFGEVLSTASNRLAAQCAIQLGEAVRSGEVVGVTDIVPAMISIGVHYRPELLDCGDDRCPFEVLMGQIEAVLRRASSGPAAEPRLVEIPVCYGGEHGPDLLEVADTLGLTPDALIALHSGEPLDVLMLGFAPGHPYIGVLDERLSPPRRATPRTRVAAGSIGLANRQSVIYPLELPGGWNLIGRTPLTLFDAERPEPCLLRSGDRIRFVPVDAHTFDALERQERAS